MHRFIQFAIAPLVAASLAACGGGGGALTATASTASAAADSGLLSDASAATARLAPGSAAGGTVAVAAGTPAAAPSSPASAAVPGQPGLQALALPPYAAPGLQAGASVALGALDNGGFALAWLLPSTGTPASLRVQAFDPRGQATGAPLTLPLDRPLAGAALGVLGDGSVVAAFTQVQDDTAAATETRSLLLTRWDRNGSPVVAGQPVRQVTASLMASAGPSGEARVIPTRDGGFALAWQESAVVPGSTPLLTAQLQRFDAAGAALGAAQLLDDRLSPARQPDLSRIAALPGGGVLVPRLFSALDPSPVLELDWRPVGSAGRSAAVPANAQAASAGGLPVGTQLQPLEGGGYIALRPDGLQRFGNDGLALGPLSPLAQGGALVALRGGGFVVIGWDGSAQAFDAQAQPVGARLALALPQAPQPPLSSALASGGVAQAMPGDAQFSLDLLLPTR
ncbi:MULTISPECIES: hypothetical protein [Ramlibacter]|uniref:Uncharacterized protein n=1 Tax=Ramlibacter aquaticus TaxID=2780094 RepID=A0ABR9SDC5_9BURK|nr:MULTISPECIES: hypothetical protein [Ramlibacter]MBE7940356.1 hypothetical protein [Ramlibacter aquaticus]